MYGEKTTEQLLQDWGVWLRSYQLGNNCSPLYRFMRAKTGGSVAAPFVDDEGAMKVDRLVARLKARDREAGKAVMYYYGLGLRYRDVAKRMKLSETATRTLVKAGAAWIDCGLHLTSAA